MKQIQKIGQLILFVLILLGFNSCDKKDNIAAFEVFGDVMIIKRMDSDQSKFARSYFAYGNYPMSSASVSLPEDGTITLTSTDEKLRIYAKQPTPADFSSDSPMIGSYEFTVVNEGIEHMVTDQLTFNDLPYANITGANYNSGAIMVEWETVSNASKYEVRLVNSSNELLLKSSLLPDNSTLFQIKDNFLIAPESGKTYTVEVRAIEYEEDATDGNLDYNINEISIATTSVIWGE